MSNGFRYQEQAIHIVDESYGHGYVVRGQVDGDDQPAVCIIDYGLDEQVKRLLAQLVEGEKELDSHIEGISFGTGAWFYTNRSGVCNSIFRALKAEGFTNDPLGRRYIGNETIKDDLGVLPVEGHYQITENAQGHFRNKLESVFHCAGIPSEIISFRTLPSTRPNTPFFIVQSRLTETVADKGKIREWCRRLLPEATFSRIDISEGYVDLGFYSNVPLHELVHKFAPSFPPDPVDGYQEVQFDMPFAVSEAQVSLMYHQLVETGAAISCTRRGDDQLVVEVPCCYARGGTVNRAFEHRLYYILSYIQENMKAAPDYTLMEKRRKLGEAVQDRPIIPTGRLRKCLPGIPAVVQRIGTANESDIPYLFSRFPQDEVFLMCESGNFIAARRQGDGTVPLYHGVLRHHQRIDNIWEYYPHLVKVGQGRVLCGV